jgi:hypothetical protein
MAQMFLTDNNPLDGTFIARQFVNKLSLGQVGFFNMWFSPGPVIATSTFPKISRKKVPPKLYGFGLHGQFDGKNCI